MRAQQHVLYSNGTIQIRDILALIPTVAAHVYEYHDYGLGGCCVLLEEAVQQCLGFC